MMTEPANTKAIGKIQRRAIKMLQVSKKVYVQHCLFYSDNTQSFIIRDEAGEFLELKLRQFQSLIDRKIIVFGTNYQPNIDTHISKWHLNETLRM